MKSSTWQPPDMLASGQDRAGWAEDLVQEGERWLGQQPSYKDLNRSIDLIAGKPDVASQENRSKLTTNRAKRSLREIIGTLSDTRYLDSFTTDNKAFTDEAEMLNKIAKAIYYESSFDRAMKGCVQWMCAGGSGYIWPVYRSTRMGPGASRAICFDVYGPCDVLPFMMPQNNDIQACYAVTVIRMMPLPEAHSKFPAFQHKLKAVGKRRFNASTVVTTRMAMIERWRMGNQEKGPWSQNYCEIRYTLIRDMRLNTTHMPVPMGDAGSSWAYVVPFLGMDIPSRETEPGVDGKMQRKLKAASEEDCYLYPNMRLMITASGVDVPLYDGPAFDWHGRFPARFSVDDWPWEPLGYSLVRDVYDMERARQFMEQTIDMVAKARMDPGLAYDMNAGLNAGNMDDLDPWEVRKRLGVDGDPSKVMTTLVPRDLMEVPGWVMEWRKELADMEDYQLGVNAMSNLTKAKMNVAQEGMEKLLEMAGPLVKDISRSMEPPMRDVMEMTKYDILQYFDTARTMRYVGPDGMSEMVFDFDPSTLVPSHMMNEDKSNPTVFGSRMERAKIFAENLRLSITPYSLHAVTQTQQKLMMLQLFRSGFPISPDTVARALDMPNWGSIDGNTELDRWQNWKKIEVEFAAQIKALGQSLLGTPQAGVGDGGGPKATGGRPPSGKKPIHSELKAGALGPRAVVSQS